MVRVPETAPYGEWRSPITIETVIAASHGVREVRLDGRDVLWLEERPAERGRQALMRSHDGAIDEVVPGANVRTRAHEYGGAPFLAANGIVWYSEFGDGRLYEARPGERPRPLTAAAPLRYADIELDAGRRRLICVREDHRPESLGAHGEAVNEIVAVPLDGGDAVRLERGHDFYASPRLSPDGTTLTWICWDHPNMPWDSTELWVATVTADGLGDLRRIAPGAPDESIANPAWSPDGVLHAVSDRTGWWNLYRLEGDRLAPIAPADMEFAHPAWQFGMSSYAFADQGIVALARSEGRDRLVLIEPGGVTSDLGMPDSEIEWLNASGGLVAYAGGGPAQPMSVIELGLEEGSRRVLRASRDDAVDPRYISAPEPISFPTGGGEIAHANFYAPRNPDFTAPPAALPPLVVKTHGGPTGAASTSLRLAFQLFTSRGIAVVDVDYRGSSGYGRAYREALRGEWGIADIEDCVAAVRYLADRGSIDPARVAISGASAGGFTTLAALAFTDTFTAGVSYYGVADLEALARDTHKFESRYLDRLVGPYPEALETYRERSPIEHVDRLHSPLLLLQGTEDRVVPPSQAEQMAAALRTRGVPYALLLFEGEDHGFRRSESHRRAFGAELSFYGQVFGFEPADELEPIHLERTGERHSD